MKLQGRGLTVWELGADYSAYTLASPVALWFGQFARLSRRMGESFSCLLAAAMLMDLVAVLHLPIGLQRGNCWQT